MVVELIKIVYYMGYGWLTPSPLTTKSGRAAKTCGDLQLSLTELPADTILCSEHTINNPA